jgi:hypothetical protein
MTIKGPHRTLRCEVLSHSSRDRLPSHLPVLERNVGPYELVAAITVLSHSLYTQLNSQANLEQLKFSKTYSSTWL